MPYSRLEPALKGDRAVQLVPVTRSQASPAAVHLPDGQPALPFDHQAMVERAVTTLRDQYAQRADPHRLLERTPFTLTELRRTHEAIAGHPFQRDAFARRVYPAEVQETTGRRDDTGGRPATLYHLRDSAAG